MKDEWLSFSERGLVSILGDNEANDWFMIPRQSFDVVNSFTAEQEECSDSSSENLPEVETWSVYDYMNVGSLADLVVDYFGSKSAPLSPE